MKRTKLCFIGLFVLLLLSLVGCGGGGGSTTNALNLFITDDASAQYSGVWVKLYKAELKGDGDKSVTLFQSTEGVTVNLRQLNDGASKFLLLAPGKVPSGTYNKVQFEVNKTVNLVATGSGAASTAVFPDSLNLQDGNSNLSLNLAPAITMPGATKVVVDFDLKNWDVVNGVITPVLKHHDGTGLEDGSRHERFQYTGLIGSLTGTAPIQAFDMTLKTGGTIHVTTDDSTDINGQGDNAGLQGGRVADIYGIFDPTTNSVKANIIHYISTNESHDLAKATGKPSNENSEAGSFDLAPKFTQGFAPKGEKISVTTNGETQYRGRNGATMTQGDFFAAMAAAGDNACVDMEGTFSEGSNTLAAKSLHIENEAQFADAAAGGKTMNPDREMFTFTINVARSTGINGIGENLQVKLASDCEIKGPHGVTTTKEQFFSLMAEKSRLVGVKGLYNPDTQTLTASRIEYVVDQVVNFTAKGSSSNPDNQAGTFDYTVTQLTGVDIPHTAPIHLSVTPNTIFANADGSDLSLDSFFLLLMNHSRKLNISGTVTMPDGTIQVNRIDVVADEVVLADAQGASSNPNSEAGTFAMSIASHHNFDPAEGAMIVNLGEGVVLKGPQGISINRAQLYSYLNEHSRTVKVTGRYSDGVFTASKVELIFTQ